MSDLSDSISSFRKATSELKGAFTASQQVASNVYDVVKKASNPVTVKEFEPKRIDSPIKLMDILISQADSLERSAIAAEDQVTRLQELLDVAKQQASIAEEKAIESKKQAKRSRFHAILSLVFAGLSAFATFAYPWLSRFLSFP